MSKANVVVMKAGAKKQFIDASTLGELRQLVGAANMLASINGDAVTDDSKELSENDVVSFTEQVKGAARKAKVKTARKTVKRITKKAIKKATKRSYSKGK